MEQGEIYKTVKGCTEGLFKEKGSKFLAFVYPCSTPSEAKEKINALRKKHPDAVHVCSAWRFGKSRSEDRFSDDGEPSGSAGRPIHGQIQAFGLTNVLVAVVRYYGGTNLGVGGLVQAYKTAASDALEKAETETEFLSDYFELRYPFDQTGEAMNLLNKATAMITARHFDEHGPMVEFKIRKQKSAALSTEIQNGLHYTLIKKGTDE